MLLFFGCLKSTCTNDASLRGTFLYFFSIQLPIFQIEDKCKTLFYVLYEWLTDMFTRMINMKW